MQSISAPPSPTINSDQSNPFRVIASNGVLRDEADVPYDGQTKAERSRRMVTTEQPLIVLPQLAVKIGLDEAIFVQQVYYWTSGPKAQVRDGFAWVYNSITDWREQFPFWSRSHLARVIASARKQGVVIATDDYNQHPSDRTYWYRVNPDHPALSLPNQQIPESGYGPANGQKPAQPSQIPDSGYALPKSRIRNGQIPESERPNPESGTTLPETTTETTSENAAADVYVAFVQAVTGKQPRSIGPKDLETATALVDMGAEPADLPPLLDWLKTQTPFKNGFSFAAVKSQYLAWRTSQPRPVHANGCGPKSQADLAALPFGAWKQGVYQNLQQWRADKRAGCLAQLDGSRPDVR